MSSEAKKGLLPEGGEMLIFAIALFLGFAGIIALMWILK
jgi:hypothetical protein